MRPSTNSTGNSIRLLLLINHLDIFQYVRGKKRKCSWNLNVKDALNFHTETSIISISSLYGINSKMFTEIVIGIINKAAYIE